MFLLALLHFLRKKLLNVSIFLLLFIVKSRSKFALCLTEEIEEIFLPLAASFSVLFGKNFLVFAFLNF